MRAVANGNGHREIWVYDPQQTERIIERMFRERSGIFEDEQGTWLTAVAAKKIYHIWDANLGDWRNEDCPFLGRKIKYKLLRRFKRNGRYQSRYVYLETDLQTIAATQAASTGAATYQDAEGTWLFAREVAHRTGWPADGLSYYRDKKWSCLPSQKLRAKKVAAKHHPHYPRISRDELWVYHEEDVERIVAYRRGEEPPGSDQSSNATDNRTASLVEASSHVPSQTANAILDPPCPQSDFLSGPYPGHIPKASSPRPPPGRREGSRPSVLLRRICGERATGERGTEGRAEVWEALRSQEDGGRSLIQLEVVREVGANPPLAQEPLVGGVLVLGLTGVPVSFFA
jgi:hypothetical protein